MFRLPTQGIPTWLDKSLTILKPSYRLSDAILKTSYRLSDAIPKTSYRLSDAIHIEVLVQAEIFLIHCRRSLWQLLSRISLGASHLLKNTHQITRYAHSNITFYDSATQFEWSLRFREWVTRIKLWGYIRCICVRSFGRGLGTWLITLCTRTLEDCIWECVYHPFALDHANPSVVFFKTTH